MAIKLRKQVVVIGGGFGGLAVTRALARQAVQVTLVDRRNHHLFQPLFYQVAMAGLSPAEIAVPIRSVLRRQRNARVLLAEAMRIDTPVGLVLSNLPARGAADHGPRFPERLVRFTPSSG